MARTSSQLYQDILSVNEGDRDVSTSKTLLKKLALAAANLAAAFEAVGLDRGDPSVSPTAASLYTAVDAINPADPDIVTTQELMKNLGLITAKIAMQIEAQTSGIFPQEKELEVDAEVSLSASVIANITRVSETLEVETTMSAEIETVVVEA